MTSIPDRPIIFIASPFAVKDGDPSTDANEAFARALCRIVAKAGGAPFAPHLFCPSFLRDDLPAERNLGIEIGIAFMARAEEAFFVLPKWRTSFSIGMRAEHEHALVLVPRVEIIQAPLGDDLDFFAAVIATRSWARS